MTLLNKVEAFFIPRPKTEKFNGRRYTNSDRVCRVGDRVLVMPVEGKSHSKEPYQATIVIQPVSWVDGKQNEICTKVTGMYSAVMNEYLFNRLKPINL